MEQSEAVKKAILRLYDAMGSADMEAVSSAFSREYGVLAIGTDPTEWWQGHSAIMDAFRRQFEGSGTRRVIAGDLAAYEEGTMGWAADCRTKHLSDGKDLTIRETFVLRLEEGDWKIVQFHASLAMLDAVV